MRRFPEVTTLDTFDFAAPEGINATQLHTLARGEWVTAPEDLIFAGPIGTGKTHLAIAHSAMKSSRISKDLGATTGCPGRSILILLVAPL